MWTPEQFAADFKKRWEGGLSLDPADTGNWVGKTLVGSKYGVTAQALADYRKVPVTSITPEIMKVLTFEEAGRIALQGYYHVRGIDTLPWGRVPAIVFDFGYNAGHGRAVKILQKMLGVGDDGQIGKGTRAAYAALLGKIGEVELAKRYTAARIAYYVSLKNPKFIKGWTNRANYFLRGHAEKWWERFAA